MTDKTSVRIEKVTEPPASDAGSTLVPMLVAGLVLVVVGMVIIMAFV